MSQAYNHALHRFAIFVAGCPGGFLVPRPFLSPQPPPSSAPGLPQVEKAGFPSIHFLGWLTLAATFLQVILGAPFRHKQANLVPHLLGAALVTAMVIWTAAVLRRRFGSVAPIVRVRILLHSLLGIQIILGGAAWWSRLTTANAPQPMPVMVTLTVIHTVFG